jgi:hypothetical protein
MGAAAVVARWYNDVEEHLGAVIMIRCQASDSQMNSSNTQEAADLPAAAAHATA